MILRGSCQRVMFMEMDMLHSAGNALLIILDPIRMGYLFGAPGHAASAATTLDGYPMTRRGEAGRALGASYMSALIGGLFGAALMGISLPLLRPIILFMGSPELLAIAVFGISMVSSL